MIGSTEVQCSSAASPLVGRPPIRRQKLFDLLGARSQFVPFAPFTLKQKHRLGQLRRDIRGLARSARHCRAWRWGSNRCFGG